MLLILVFRNIVVLLCVVFGLVVLVIVVICRVSGGVSLLLICSGGRVRVLVWWGVSVMLCSVCEVMLLLFYCIWWLLVWLLRLKLVCNGV